MKIYRRTTHETLYKSKKTTIKETVEEAVTNKVILYRADLSGSDLSGADLNWANLGGSDLSRSNLGRVNFYRVNLSGADLSGSSLNWANLCGANLYRANLNGVSNYHESHEVFFELVRGQKTGIFTAEEWGIIGILVIHRLCWETIKKRFGKSILPIFRKVADAGFGEYLKRYEEILGE